MLKIFLPLCMVFVFMVFVPAFGQDAKAKDSLPVEQPAIKESPKSQEASAENFQEQTVRGTVKEIAQDGSYIVVDDAKILVTKELLEDSYLEVGDKVEVTAEKTDTGLKAKTCSYIFEEESEPKLEEGTLDMEGLPKE